VAAKQEKNIPGDAQAILNDVDTYEDTVRAILAFIHELSWDDRAKIVRKDIVHRHGSAHGVPGRDPVTPDISLQVGEDFILLGDVKASFAREDKSRRSIVDQMMKYDDALDPLLGADDAPKEGGTVLLTHYTRKVDAADYLKRAPTFKPRRPFGLVAFVRSDQGEQHFTLERHYGAIVPSGKDKKLRRVVPIKLEHIAGYVVKFYDTDPPVAHLLATLWDLILPSLSTEEEFARHSIEGRARRGDNAATESTPDSGPEPEQDGHNKTRNGSMPIEFSVDDVAERLRESFSLRTFDSTLPGAPRTKAVKVALDALVRFKLAEASDDNRRYTVLYRKLKGGTLQYFAKRLAAKKRKTRRAPPRDTNKQLKLFE
jgi:hypothetical protein